MFPMMALAGMIPGIASAAGGLFGMFGKKNKNPADAANGYLDQIPGQVNPYYQPYMDAGKGALNTLQGQYGNLLNNTGDVYNKLAGGYKESPGYQFALKQALGAGQNSSAAGGMLGTPADQQQQMGIAQDLSSKDFGNYMQNQMGLYGAGLSGMGNINQMGFDASTGYGNMLGSILGQKAQNAFSGQAGMNQGRQQNMNDIFGGIGGAASGYFNNQHINDILKQLGFGG